ncbi:MAG: hypothetical protein M0R51_17055 [Clostridia bacterium]|jgi:ATP-dependent protease HslVU (ClpYQ) peptidase subunit|nr:hypothetical protein [Clostridia bacterium]
MIKITVEDSETKTTETFFGDTVLMLANRKNLGLMHGRMFTSGTYGDLARAYLALGNMILQNFNEQLEKEKPELFKQAREEYQADEERLQATVKKKKKVGKEE